MKIYRSPLKLLGEEVNPKEIDQEVVRRKRKELLLRFNLTSDTTIEVAGRAYDKESLVKAFEEFEEDVDFHLMLAKYPLFVDFLENGNTEYFENPDERGWHLVEIPVIKNKVKFYFIDQFNETLYRLVSSKDFRDSNRAKRLLERNFPIPEDWKGSCFLKTHDWFEEKLKELEKLADSGAIIIKKAGRWRFQEAIFPIFKYEFINKFKLMPETFDGLKIKFARIINDLLMQAFTQESKLNNFDRDTLYEIQQMSYFAYDQLNEPAMYQNAQAIGRILNAPEISNFHINPDLKRAIIILVLFLLVFTIFKRILLS
jgi:hypothetical protein